MKTISEKLKEMGKKTCEDCIGCDYCSEYDKYDINFIWSLPETQDVRTECSLFKDKAEVVPRSEVEELQKRINDYERVVGKLSFTVDGVPILIIGENVEYIQKELANGFKYIAVKKAKQEVAREIFKKIEKNTIQAIKKLKDTKEGVTDQNLRNYINGKIGEVENTQTFIAELKKKYIGEI